MLDEGGAINVVMESGKACPGVLIKTTSEK